MPYCCRTHRAIAEASGADRALSKRRLVRAMVLYARIPFHFAEL